MSPREKKLLIFFGIGGFAVLNLLGFNSFMKAQASITGQHAQALTKLNSAKRISESREEITPQIEWLAANEPRPTDYQLVQTSLQEFADKEVTAAGLTPKSQKLLPTDTTGPYFHRVKIKLTVSGPEAALYRWFSRLNSVETLRCVTYIRLSPNKENDTLIDCTADVEQWFVPATST